MVAGAALRPGDRVVELGAGTGVFTRLLGNHPGPVLALEPAARLAARAREVAPTVEVVEALAQDLPELLVERGWPRVDAVVSGLPFAVWPAEWQNAVLDAVAASLHADGRFVTFTYAHSPWLPAGRRFAARLRERCTRVELGPVLWANVTPARIYTGYGLGEPGGIRCRTRG
jgi:phospholipid N-methyltransferase